MIHFLFGLWAVLFGVPAIQVGDKVTGDGLDPDQIFRIVSIRGTIVTLSNAPEAHNSLGAR
jgi:hypothetical protein